MWARLQIICFSGQVLPSPCKGNFSLQLLPKHYVQFFYYFSDQLLVHLVSLLVFCGFVFSDFDFYFICFEIIGPDEPLNLIGSLCCKLIIFAQNHILFPANENGSVKQKQSDFNFQWVDGTRNASFVTLCVYIASTETCLKHGNQHH